jgi:hypothetical protein
MLSNRTPRLADARASSTCSRGLGGAVYDGNDSGAFSSPTCADRVELEFDEDDGDTFAGYAAVVNTTTDVG